MPVKRGPSTNYVIDDQKPGCSGWNQNYDEIIVISSDDDDEVRLFNILQSFLYPRDYSAIAIMFSAARMKPIKQIIVSH